MSAGAAAAEPGVLTEVPDKLKRLAKFIMRSFYSIEHALIVDLLVRNSIMKEDDLAELLKFDKKQLRTLLMKIKNDKLLKQVMRVETQADGRANRHYYYYINYKTFVNVVRFKLDRMRQKIENRERDSTCKALFKCTKCSKTYNEFDAQLLFDPVSMDMKCTYCGESVEEDESAVPRRDSVTQMVKFNEQMKPIFDLLRDVENIKLAQEILEPTPVQLPDARKRGGERGVNAGGPQHGWREGNRTTADLYHQDVTINIGGDNQGPAENQPAPKERPIWMTASTVDGAIIEMAPSASGAVPSEKSGARHSDKANEGEIMRALLAHERKVGQRPSFHHEPNSDNESDASASDEEFPMATNHLMTEDRFAFGVPMDGGMPVRQEEEEEEEEEDMVVMVAGRPVALEDITSELIEQMTPAEKDGYIRLAQQAHADLYE
ncbi:general transcription factor IIE subunit 1-like [Diadema setosum]|uniref:general transcription factor IIE subunit 1-like n=1 Tax=Diadema setosum TaxID=31175 RepID=UPI003B3A84B2